MVDYAPIPNDPLGCLDDFYDAYEDPALDVFENGGEVDDVATEAAKSVAIALGRCRLFGVDIPKEFDFTLPYGLAAAAATSLQVDVREWTRLAEDLPTWWDDAEPLEAEERLQDLLECRMAVWAAAVAFDEAADYSLFPIPPEAQTFEQAWLQLADDIERFDNSLARLENVELFSQLAGTYLLSNWRSVLAEPYRDLLPWWLDGTLEQENRRQDAIAKATLPPPDVWRAVCDCMEAIDAVVYRHPAALLLDHALEASLAADVKHDDTAGFPQVEWRSPDGQYEASLSVVKTGRGGGEAAYRVEVSFAAAGGGLAEELDGCTCRLVDVESTIESLSRGHVARFPYDAIHRSLREGRSHLVLEVGDGHAEWQAVEIH
jgi:hypothetical protein